MADQDPNLTDQLPGIDDQPQQPPQPSQQPPAFQPPSFGSTEPEKPILDQDNREDFPEDFNNPRPGLWDWFKGHYLMVIGGVLVAVLVALAALFFLRNANDKGPESANVLLSIKGPDKLASGNEGEYRIIYTNAENSDLTNIDLEVFYPSNFKFSSADPEPTSSNGQRFSLPILRQGQTGEVKVRGKLSGGTGESKEIRAKLNFSMASFSSNFNTEASFRTELTAPELEMEITGPIDVVNGQSTTFTVNYKNISGREFDATAVELHYPEGFKFISAVPVPSKNQNYWSLGKIPVDAMGKIEVTGNFIGDPGTEMQVRGDLGLALPGGLAPQIQASARFKIQPSTLTIMQEADPEGVVTLGDTISYSLEYGNFGSVGQKNVVVTATLEGAALDLSKLKVPNGIITGNTITWKAATINALGLVSPNQKGELNFQVPLKATNSTNLKNQVIKSSIAIYSDQVTNQIRGQDLELKVASEVGMIVSGRYVNGAMPMKVGQPTTFEITTLLTNLSNDLDDTLLVASMPLPASAWGNFVLPDSEKGNVSFDGNGSLIRWRAGKLDAFVGKFSPARTMSFRLTVTPSESDRGTNMTLLRDVQATGMDSFTGQEAKSTQLKSFTVQDLNDDQIDANGASVE